MIHNTSWIGSDIYEKAKEIATHQNKDELIQEILSKVYNCCYEGSDGDTICTEITQAICEWNENISNLTQPEIDFLAKLLKLPNVICTFVRKCDHCLLVWVISTEYNESVFDSITDIVIEFEAENCSTVDYIYVPKSELLKIPPLTRAYKLRSSNQIKK